MLQVQAVGDLPPVQIPVPPQPLSKQEEGFNTIRRTQDTALWALDQRNDDSETEVPVLVGQKTEEGESTSTEEHTSIESPPTEENVQSETEEYPDVLIHEEEEDLEEKIAALEEKIEALNEELAGKEAIINTKVKEKTEHFEREKQAFRLAVREAEEESEGLKKKVGEISSELAVKIEEYKILEAEKDELGRTLEAKGEETERCNEQEKKLAALEEKIESLKKQLTDKEAIIESREELKAGNDEDQVLEASKKELYEALKAEKDELSRTLEALKKELEDQKAIIELKDKQIANAENASFALRLEAGGTLEESDRLKKEIAEIRSKLEENGAFLAELEAKREENVRLAAEKDAERLLKVNAEAKNAILERELKSQEEHLQANGKKIEKLRQTKKKIKSTLGVVNEDLDTKEKDLRAADKDLRDAKNSISDHKLVMCTSVAGYALVTNLSSGVRAVATYAPSLMKTSYASTVAEASYLAGTVPGQFMVTKATAASSWVASTSAGQWVSSSIYPVVAAKVSVVVSQAMIHGRSIAVHTLKWMRNVTVLNNVSPVYGAIFTTAVSLLAVIAAGMLKRSFELSDNHDFTLLTLTHALTGATLYGVSVGLVKAGVTTAAMTASGAAILTTAALASFLFMKAIQSR